jgi:hypothetical protein
MPDDALPAALHQRRNCTTGSDVRPAQECGRAAPSIQRWKYMRHIFVALSYRHIKKRGLLGAINQPSQHFGTVGKVALCTTKIVNFLPSFGVNANLDQLIFGPRLAFAHDGLLKIGGAGITPRTISPVFFQATPDLTGPCKTKPDRAQPNLTGPHQTQQANKYVAHTKMSTLNLKECT